MMSAALHRMTPQKIESQQVELPPVFMRHFEFHSLHLPLGLDAEVNVVDAGEDQSGWEQEGTT